MYTRIILMAVQYFFLTLTINYKTIQICQMKKI